jgi:hypothetical protein
MYYNGMIKQKSQHTLISHCTLARDEDIFIREIWKKSTKSGVLLLTSIQESWYEPLSRDRKPVRLKRFHDKTVIKFHYLVQNVRRTIWQTKTHEAILHIFMMAYIDGIAAQSNSTRLVCVEDSELRSVIYLAVQPHFRMKRITIKWFIYAWSECMDWYSTRN